MRDVLGHLSRYLAWILNNLSYNVLALSSDYIQLGTTTVLQFFRRAPFAIFKKKCQDIYIPIKYPTTQDFFPTSKRSR